MSGATLNHFATFSFRDAFWALDARERRRVCDGWLAELRDAVPQVEAYQVYPTRREADLLLWSALSAEEPRAPYAFFEAFARALTSRRALIEPGPTLWGLTRPSPYARRASDRAIDPLAGEHDPYLIVYPFAKTAEWYLLAAEPRQTMMNEHIRVGRKYGEVRQLLLYSFGLQDQEFVVIYETEDLAAFSSLVRDLRGTEGRRFTSLDTPVWTALHRPGDEPFALWG